MNSTAFSPLITKSVNGVTTVPPPVGAQESLLYVPEPQISQVFRYVIYAILFLFAVVGNIAVCIIPFRQKRMRTFTYFLITNLAVSDIGTMLCLPPLLLYEKLGTWIMGSAMCKLVNPSLAMFSIITTNTLVAIAIDRFIALVFPFRERPQKKQTILVISLTWLLAFGCVLPSFGSKEIVPTADPETGIVYLLCNEVFPGKTEDDRLLFMKVYNVLIYLINNALPILIISGVYIIIIFKLRGISVSKAFKRKSSKSSTDGFSQPGALTTDEVYKKQKNEREKKFTQMLLSVVIVFVLFYVPVQTFFLVSSLVPEHVYNWKYTFITYSYLYLMMWVPNALNPILYGSMNEQYAKAFKRIFRCKRVGKDYSSATKGSYSQAPTAHHRNDATQLTRDTELTLM